MLHLGPVFHWSHQRPRLPVSALFHHSLAHSTQRQANGLPKCKTINFNLHVTKPSPSFIKRMFFLANNMQQIESIEVVLSTNSSSLTVPQFQKEVRNSETACKQF